MSGDRLVDPDLEVEGAEDERQVEAALRPRSLAEFIGQARVREQLGLVLDAARGRGRVPDHVLLSGPPGLGKPVSVESLILMGDGSRKRMGDVAVGDWVISAEGRPELVEAVHEQGGARLPSPRHGDGTFRGGSAGPSVPHPGRIGQGR